ncbi:recombinase family protein [Actinomadura harenae]|uniref:recombinase family protein n=1 Tax=Actinomadura harenae TaxID=2483351 RepID=UPI001F454AF5
MDYLRPGDTLVVPSLDRLGRSLQDPIAIVGACANAAPGAAPCTKPWTPPPPAAAARSSTSSPP